MSAGELVEALATLLTDLSDEELQAAGFAFVPLPYSSAGGHPLLGGGAFASGALAHCEQPVMSVSTELAAPGKQEHFTSDVMTRSAILLARTMYDRSAYPKDQAGKSFRDPSAMLVAGILRAGLVLVEDVRRAIFVEGYEGTAFSFLVSRLPAAPPARRGGDVFLPPVFKADANVRVYVDLVAPQQVLNYVSAQCSL